MVAFVAYVTCFIQNRPVCLLDLKPHLENIAVLKYLQKEVLDLTLWDLLGTLKKCELFQWAEKILCTLGSNPPLGGPGPPLQRDQDHWQS